MPTPSSYMRDRMNAARHEVPKGYCQWCCLPKEYDPGHRPEGFDKDESFDVPSKRFNEYMTARRKMYRMALLELPEAELLKMPEPCNSKWRHPIYLEVLELAKDKPRPTAWDRLTEADEPTVKQTPEDFKASLQVLVDQAIQDGIPKAQIKRTLKLFKVR